MQSQGVRGGAAQHIAGRAGDGELAGGGVRHVDGEEARLLAGVVGVEDLLLLPEPGQAPGDVPGWRVARHSASHGRGVCPVVHRPG